MRLKGTLEETEPGRRGMRPVYLAAPAMWPPARRAPSAVAESADRRAAGFDLTRDLGYRYPGSEDPDADRTLAEICRARLDHRYAGEPEHGRARQRLEEELEVIRSLRLSGFFLLHFDILELAREVAAEVRGPGSLRGLLPPGRGRGSSVSSIVCYLTGLSHVDPVRNGLFLGRALNEEITEAPDIDLDFPRDIREKLIPRVHERYGEERSGAGRGVRLLPVAKRHPRLRQGAGPAAGRGRASGPHGRPVRPPRVGGVGHGDGDRRGASSVGALAGACSPGARRVGAPAASLSASRRNGDLHQAADRRLPCPAGGDEGRQLIQWDKDSCGRRLPEDRPAGAGDAVGGRAASRRSRRGERIDLSESPSTTRRPSGRSGRRTRQGVPDREPGADADAADAPENLDDPSRSGGAGAPPGPIQGGAASYLERREKLRKDPSFRVPYEHPSLEPILADTLPGAIVFQEQVIQVAASLAVQRRRGRGLRRAMSRKRSRRRSWPIAINSSPGRGAGRDAGGGGARLRAGPRLLGVRVPEGPRGRLWPARLPVDLASGPLRT